MFLPSLSHIKSGEGMEGRITDSTKDEKTSQNTKNANQELPPSIMTHITNAQREHPDFALLNFRLAFLKLKVYLLDQQEDGTVLHQQFDQAIRNYTNYLVLNYLEKVLVLIAQKPQDKKELLDQMSSFVSQIAQLFELITYKDKTDVLKLLEIYKFITIQYQVLELYKNVFDIAQKALELCSKVHDLLEKDKYAEQEYRQFFQAIISEPLKKAIVAPPKSELKANPQQNTLKNQWKILKKTKLLPAPKLFREHARDLLQFLAKIKQSGHFNFIDLQRLRNTNTTLSADLKVIKKEDGIEKIQKLRKHIEKYNSEVQECEEYLSIFMHVLLAEKSGERFVATLLPTLESIPDFVPDSDLFLTSSYPIPFKEEKTLASEKDPIVSDQKLIPHARKPAIAPPKSAIHHVKIVDTVSEKRFGLFYFSELQQIKVKQDSYFSTRLMTKEESDELWNKRSKFPWQWP